jgi:hypothetical protein
VLQLCVGHSVHRVAGDLPRQVLQVVPLGQSRGVPALSEFLIVDGPIRVGRLRQCRLRVKPGRLCVTWVAPFEATTVDLRDLADGCLLHIQRRLRGQPASVRE